MAKCLDFNSIQQPVWEVTLRDDARTTFRITLPTERLIERLNTYLPELKSVANTNDGSSARVVYELAAELISCNLDGIKVTAEELRDKYRMAYSDMFVFFPAYKEFINEIESAKN